MKFVRLGLIKRCNIVSMHPIQIKHSSCINVIDISRHCYCYFKFKTWSVIASMLLSFRYQHIKFNTSSLSARMTVYCHKPTLFLVLSRCKMKPHLNWAQIYFYNSSKNTSATTIEHQNQRHPKCICVTLK